MVARVGNYIDRYRYMELPNENSDRTLRNVGWKFLCRTNAG